MNQINEEAKTDQEFESQREACFYSFAAWFQKHYPLTRMNELLKDKQNQLHIFFAHLFFDPSSQPLLTQESIQQSQGENDPLWEAVTAFAARNKMSLDSPGWNAYSTVDTVLDCLGLSGSEGVNSLAFKINEKLKPSTQRHLRSYIKFLESEGLDTDPLSSYTGR